MDKQFATGVFSKVISDVPGVDGVSRWTDVVPDSQLAAHQAKIERIGGVVVSVEKDSRERCVRCAAHRIKNHTYCWFCTCA